MKKTAEPEWEWTPIEVTCGSCGEANTVHEQPPELLAQGVKWECRHCGALNQLGGTEPVSPTFLLECGGCHRTFSESTPDADRPELAADGSWTCECGVKNRHVAAGENGSGSDKQKVG